MKIKIHWKKTDVEHIAKHGVRAEEVERALENRNVYLWKEKHKDIPYLYCIGNTGKDTSLSF